MRGSLLALLLVAACTAGAPSESVPAPTVAPERVSVTPEPLPADPEPTADPGGFEVTRALEHARVLSVDIGARMSGTDGDERGARYIEAELASLGYVAERRAFPLPQGGESWNVVGTPPGVDPSAGPYLIVGGHHDSLNGPGANDNASGIGVVLEVARALVAEPGALPVIVVAFGAEERQPVPGRRENHVGSRAYVAAMVEAERSNLVALVNVDMVGRGDGLHCARMDRGPREATQRCVEVAGRIGVPATERVTPDWSDNGPFLRAGMDAMWIWAGEDPAFHSPQDTFDRLQPRAVEWAGRLALEALRSYG